MMVDYGVNLVDTYKHMLGLNNKQRAKGEKVSTLAEPLAFIKTML